MPRVFISYRHDDSAEVARRLYDRLAAAYGADSIFMDARSIPFGEDFRTKIRAAIQGCDVMLALVGAGWSGATSERRRLDSLDDYIFLEIKEAIQRAIPVVPILIGRVSMPKPEDL